MRSIVTRLLGIALLVSWGTSQVTHASAPCSNSSFSILDVGAAATTFNITGISGSLNDKG
jgi:hypothetical protein